MRRSNVSTLGTAMYWPTSEEWYSLAQTFAANGAHRHTDYQHITFTAVPGAPLITLGTIRHVARRSASNATLGSMITLSRPPLTGGSFHSTSY